MRLKTMFKHALSVIMMMLFAVNVCGEGVVASWLCDCVEQVFEHNCCHEQQPQHRAVCHEEHESFSSAKCSVHLIELIEFQGVKSNNISSDNLFIDKVYNLELQRVLLCSSVDFLEASSVLLGHDYLLSCALKSPPALS